jgi:hypothetical protein
MGRKELKAAFDALYTVLEPLFPADVVPAKLAVVSYMYPTTHVAEWTAVNAKAQVCIINPSSGAGTLPDPNYVAQVDASVAAGLMVLGYCPTSYAARSITDTLAEVARLKQHYPKLHGVFIDEVANGGTTAQLDYYKQVYDKARSLGMVVVLNTGAACPESYMLRSDIVMDCETSAANYPSKVFATWRKNYPKERFWHCIHTCDAATMPAMVDRAKANNAGLIFVCETNAYNVLPSYFDALAVKVRS